MDWNFELTEQAALALYAKKYHQEKASGRLLRAIGIIGVAVGLWFAMEAGQAMLRPGYFYDEFDPVGGALYVVLAAVLLVLSILVFWKSRTRGLAAAVLRQQKKLGASPLGQWRVHLDEEKLVTVRAGLQESSDPSVVQKVEQYPEGLLVYLYGGAKMLALAKKEGLPVTGEVCPHHFILSTDDICEDDGNFKMNPPLRSRADVEALREALKNDVVDVIATDHAPHAEAEKNRSMKLAAFGIVGLETSAALTYTELVEKGVLTPMQMAEKMSYNPARILGLSDKGSVSAGKIADVVIFDPRKEYVIDKNTFLSKGKNTPFHGRKVKGEVRCTIVGGRIVYEGGKTID